MDDGFHAPVPKLDRFARSGPAVAVTLRHARLAFAGSVLFDGLDLELPAGSWTCLLGPSGVGKTSLLRLLAGLAPEGASAEIACGDGGGLDGRVAYMAQQDLLLPWLSLRDNALLGYRLRGTPVTAEARARVDALLARVGLSGRESALPAECSGGMRQRAALVRTLAEDRPVVLMDEPFSALDAISRLRIQEEAARLLAGRTVLLVTHDPLEALRLGDRIHVLAGRPVRLDEPLAPDGAPPRAPGDPALLNLHAKLLTRLAAAGDAA